VHHAGDLRRSSIHERKSNGGASRALHEKPENVIDAAERRGSKDAALGRRAQYSPENTSIAAATG
jgi:hypothetical protein